jgi:hypothetical protein
MVRDHSDLQEQRLADCFGGNREPALRLASSTCYFNTANEYYCRLRQKLLMLLFPTEPKWPFG